MDASQTLFEFRASDPKAINALQSSGVFDTFKLEVNYRSNQEILDFANTVLTDIEANQYANVSLKANNLAKTTLDSFEEKIKVNHQRFGGLREFPDNIEAITKHTLKPYINEKLEKGEQVAILSFTRYDVKMYEEVLKELYTDKKIVNICPKRSRDSTIISNYIKTFKKDLNFLDKKKYAKAILNAICAKIPDIMPRANDKSKKIAASFVYKWYKNNTQVIQRFANQYIRKEITLEELNIKTTQNLLSFEIRNNVIRQSLIAQKNNEEKKSEDIKNADIIISTIHSAKGLEFDNVVVNYKEPSGNLSEPDKRMYYVALTRAMKSEFILSYGTGVSSLVSENYELLRKQLES